MDEVAQVEKHGFGAEVGRLLDLVVHSLYSEREIFLRELVANAADAIDRRRFEALTEAALALPDGAKIRITPDKPGRRLHITDDGIGMGKDELIHNLGTIARSGTRAFGEALAQAKPDDRPSLIGQFGVGFYSAFMVADRVEVTSRKAGSDETWLWASDGAGEFTLASAARDTPGTDVVLHMKANADEYLEPIRLEAVIRKWADHVTVPITITQDGKDQPANEGTTLWRKPKAEVSEQSATEFYRHLGNFFDTPWVTLQWRAEGVLEFYAMVFIPGMKPFQPLDQDRASKLRLHVRRMFITDAAELLPPWLRFASGVIDTEDLPLNVSREMLQTTPVLARIRKAVTGRVISELKTKAKDAEDYGKFWDNFGSIVKEGAFDDPEHRPDVATLMRFPSSSQEGLVSFADYIARMQPEQEKIWFLVADSLDIAKNSPQLEGFRARGIEVLLLTDPIDAFWPERLDAFEGKSLESVTQATQDEFPSNADTEAQTDDLTALLAALKTALGSDVTDVRATYRLTDSACILAAADAGPDLQMQRLLRRAGRSGAGPGGAGAPTLEINPNHAVILALAPRAAESEIIAEAAANLLDLARVQDG
ncbi:MAG: molecular chaperone HtpG, partial [Acetobacteraceae bacterium]|nr:molecular chaperone HtpG [Acetobacteraceae bacterium]